VEKRETGSDGNGHKRSSVLDGGGHGGDGGSQGSGDGACSRAREDEEALNRWSCLVEGVMTSAYTRVAAQQCGRWLGGASRFARPVDVRRVATRNWAWTSVWGCGTGGRSDAPTFVPGRSAARPGARDVTRGRERAVQCQNHSV
jgi:hypothetical protein